MTDALRKKLARIAAACCDPSTTDALDKMIAGLDQSRAALAAPAVPPVNQSLTTVPAEPVAWHCPNDPDSATAFFWRRPSNGACPNCGKKLLPVVLAAAPTAQQGEQQ